MKEGEDIFFDQLLFELSLAKENYSLAISSSFNALTALLKRNPHELRIKNYNPACLSAWRANMHIQFVLDIYACTAGNPKHRPYPRPSKNENTNWRDYIDTIREELPLIYRNRTLFEDFRQNLEGYVIA